jgi:hypothetical protein
MALGHISAQIVRVNGCLPPLKQRPHSELREVQGLQADDFRARSAKYALVGDLDGQQSDRSVSNAIEANQKRSQINRPDRYPVAHIGLVARSGPAARQAVAIYFPTNPLPFLPSGDERANGAGAARQDQS